MANDTVGRFSYSFVSRMTKFLAIVVGLSLAGCMSNEVTTTQYATLAEARADRLFLRGWLPDILPPSSHSIRTSSDLDSNTSEGEFYFNRVDADTFYTQLHRGLPISASSIQWQPRAQTGLDPWWYTVDGHTWVFFCSTAAGMCSYTLR
ncbi:MAG: hypothetical protein M3Q40_04225 [Pseudomonadota bacterium]|nr:hypothetical protein [Pseudomonadota bacterium]